MVISQYQFSNCAKRCKPLGCVTSLRAKYRKAENSPDAAQQLQSGITFMPGAIAGIDALNGMQQAVFAEQAGIKIQNAGVRSARHVGLRSRSAASIWQLLRIGQLAKHTTQMRQILEIQALAQGSTQHKLRTEITFQHIVGKACFIINDALVDLFRGRQRLAVDVVERTFRSAWRCFVATARCRRRRVWRPAAL